MFLVQFRWPPARALLARGRVEKDFVVARVGLERNVQDDIGAVEFDLFVAGLAFSDGRPGSRRPGRHRYRTSNGTSARSSLRWKPLERPSQ